MRTPARLHLTKTFAVVLTAASLTFVGCGGLEEDEESKQSISAGQLGLGLTGEANAPMAEWEQDRSDHKLPSGYDFGVEFVFDLVVDQPTHMFLDSSQNYDCEAGGRLMGPDYYLVMADGTERVYDHANKSAYEDFPGKGVPDFPGLMPAGTHKLTARWYSNTSCNMDVAVTALDRYSPDNNGIAYIQYASLLGEWQQTTDGVKETSRFASSVWTQSYSVEDQEVASIQYDVWDFPFQSPPRFAARVTGTTGDIEGVNVGDTLYCLYSIVSNSEAEELVINCSAPGTTSFATDINEGATRYTR